MIDVVHIHIRESFWNIPTSVVNRTKLSISLHEHCLFRSFPRSHPWPLWTSILDKNKAPLKEGQVCYKANFVEIIAGEITFWAQSGHSNGKKWVCVSTVILRLSAGETERDDLWIMGIILAIFRPAEKFVSSGLPADGFWILPESRAFFFDINTQATSLLYQFRLKRRRGVE